MRTTNKLFKAQVQEHIIECLSTDYTTNTKEQLQEVVNEFTNWYGHHEQKLNPNIQDGFAEFLRCLPSCLSVEYTYYAVNKEMRKWFENCCEVYIEPPFEKWIEMDDLYHHLIFREFKALCKQHDIFFL